MVSRVVAVVIKDRGGLDAGIAGALASCAPALKEAGTVFVKVNAVSDLLVPGANTGSWVLSGVLRALQEIAPDARVFVGDSDASSRRQVEDAFKVWGYDRICGEYGARLVNLSEEEYVERKGVFIPKKVAESDFLLSLPVVKTHTWTGLSCALKNQFGFYPAGKHLHHLDLDNAIVNVNLAAKPDFALADATVCLEAGGPVIGRPKVCNTLFSSKDPVALDAAVADWTGIGKENITYVKLAGDKGVGSTAYELAGDDVTRQAFTPAKQNLMSTWHRRLRSSPFEPLFFRTRLFALPALTSVLYRRLWWVSGRRLCRASLRGTFYEHEFAF